MTLAKQSAGARIQRATLPATLAHQPAQGALPMRKGDLPVAALIDLYMQRYEGRDPTRAQRLAWWADHLGDTLTLADLDDDIVHAGMQALEREPNKYYAGKDCDGRSVFKRKNAPRAGATINRYIVALAAVCTWGIRQRIAPKGWAHPCRAVEKQPEGVGKTRFLDADERTRLLAACRASRWDRLYLLVLMALTTGARKAELLGLRRADIDLERGTALVGRSKNGDAKTLALVPSVIEELRRLNVKRPDALIFASARRPAQPYSFEYPWADALDAAKIKSFRFHDLRHSCASLLAANGATLLEIADVLGHRQLQMTKRYSHLTTGHKQALIGRVMGDIA